MSAPLYKVGDLVDYTPHHPAFPKPNHPFSVTRVDAGGDGRHGYWIAPVVPPKTRKLRNGRVVEEAPNWVAVVGESEITPWESTS